MLFSYNRATQSWSITEYSEKNRSNKKETLGELNALYRPAYFKSRIDETLCAKLKHKPFNIHVPTKFEILIFYKHSSLNYMIK